MVDIINSISLEGKIILNISTRQSVFDYLEKEQPKRIYLCRNIAECKKNINKADIIIVDDYFENEEQYCLLKKIIQLIFTSDLKPNFRLVLMKSELKIEDEKTRIYKRLIEDHLEALIKFKEFSRSSNIKNEMKYLRVFETHSLLV